MATIESFTNSAIDIDSLPKFESIHFEMISKKYLTKNFVTLSIWLVVFGIGWEIFAYNQPKFILNLGLGLALLVFFIFGYINAFLAQKKYGYALREKDILYRRGYLVNKVTVIPFNRIQHVTTSQGLVEKFFKIARLKLFTAGGQGSDISIPGLSPQLADDLKEAVAKKLRTEDEY